MLQATDINYLISMKPKSLEYSIILAGGKGTRMGSADLHKVCFEIDGKPSIVRAMDSYNNCGIKKQKASL